MCSSTLFTSALSCLVVFGIGSDFIIVFAIIVNSLENASICAFPANLTAFVAFNLLIIFLALFPGKNALQVIVLEPSYMSILKITFPDFVSLSSIACISPSIQTLPDSAFKSAIFTSGSFITGAEPKINGELSSSSGNGGSPSSLISAIIFDITVISPAKLSNPAFPIVLIALADLILSNISFPFAPSSAKDLHVIIPVPS